MAQPSQLTPTTTRIAYIRTTSNPEKDPQEIFTLVNDYMRQTSVADQEKGYPRHHFLFGAANGSDARILDLLLNQILDKTPDDPPTLSNERPGGTYAHVMSRHMCRSDVELHMSSARAATIAGEGILTRCGREGVATHISGATDEECDAIMLEESHYLIDFQTPNLGYRCQDWFWNNARTGQPEDNMLTNPGYDVSKHDASKMRLCYRYAGYGWKASSGGFHGNFAWECSLCGGKCKRGRCVAVKQSEGPREDRERYEKGMEKWIDECAKLPEKGDKRWMTMTVEDVCQKFRIRKMAGEKEEARWKSVDTFSGD